MAPVSHAISLADAENAAAAAWLDLRRDKAFQRFCDTHGASPDSLVAHPDGTFSLQGEVSQGVLVQFFRPFEAGGKLAPPFSAMADAFFWRTSLDVLLRHAYALARDVGRDAVGISRMNGIEATDMLRKAGPTTTHDATMASAFKFLDVFSALYRGADGDARDADPSSFSTKFHRDGDLRYLAGWMTEVPTEDLSAAATFKALGLLASIVWRAYAADVLPPEDGTPEARLRFTESLRLSLTMRAADEGIHVASGTVDFAASLLYWRARDEARMRPLPVWPVSEPAVSTLQRDQTNESKPAKPGAASIDNPSSPVMNTPSVRSQNKPETANRQEKTEIVSPWPMVVKVATFSGAVVVLGAGVSTGLTAAQKAAVVTLGNAASLAGATVLAVVAPGVGHALGVIGSSGLLFSSIADYLVSAGIAPALAKSAAVVEVMGVYILVGLGVEQSIDALPALARHPGWREALRAVVNILATIGTVSAGAPAADKADRFNIEDARYGFFNEHPRMPDRLGHSGNGVVLLSQGVLQAAEGTVSKRDDGRSAWDIFLSSYDPSGIPYGVLSH